MARDLPPGAPPKPHDPRAASEAWTERQETGEEDQFVHSLADADLIDEWRAMVHPVLVADGMRMFPDPAQMRKLKLVDATAYESGVALLTYRRADG